MTEASYYADIFGTEKDKFNCPFYWKMGACRHGEKCVRTHNKPLFSQTVLIPHMYDNPIAVPQTQNEPKKHDAESLTRHYVEFYEDIFLEVSSIGKVDELCICNNVAKHLLGNVYVKYFDVEDAKKALQILSGRYYAGRLLRPEFSPVTDFHEARCRQYENAQCERGGLCNFMHLKKLDRTYEKRLWKAVGDQLPPDMRKFSRPRDRDRDRDRGGHRDRDRSRGERRRDYDDDRYHRRDRGRGGDRGRYRDRERYRERDDRDREDRDSEMKRRRRYDDYDERRDYYRDTKRRRT